MSDTTKYRDVVDAIIKKTKEHTMNTKTTKASKASKKSTPTKQSAQLVPASKPRLPVPPPQPRMPAIQERVPNSTQAARLARMKDSVLMRTLAQALSVKRPHEGIGERNLLGYILLNKPAGGHWTFDTAGNLHIDLRTEKTHRTLFVAHVDTVHHKDGVNKIRMTESTWYAHGSQLGADDGAGVAILMHLMHAGVPAHYVFTVGEECGGVGASALVKDRPGMFSRFDRAIAFDRRGTTSVISHQGARCCSDAFAEALSTALSGDELMYMPDDSGVYTDTAEFTHLVPECTNISVGYMREHSDEEAQDIFHLQALAETAARLDWDALPTERDPLTAEEYAWGNSWNSAWAKSASTSGSKTEFDFKTFMNDDEVEAYEALLAASQDGSREALARSMATAIGSELGAEHALRVSRVVCEKLKEDEIHDALADVEFGADINQVLNDLCVGRYN